MIVKLLKIPKERWLSANYAAKLVVGYMMIHNVIKKCCIMLRWLKTKTTSCSIFYAMSFVEMNVEIENIGKDFSASFDCALPFIF